MAGDLWRGAAALTGVLAMLLLAGCGSTSSGGPGSGASDQGRQVGLYKVGTPYEINGVWYYPAEDYGYRETGIASWYGPGFHGRRTANGERYDQHDLTAAHRTLPMPSLVRVTNLENGRSLKLRINDRGPYAHNRIIDVSQRAAQLLDFESKGTARVRVEIMPEESQQLAAMARGGAAPAKMKEPEQPQTAETAVATAVPAVQREVLDDDDGQREPEGENGGTAAMPDGVVTQEAATPTNLFVQAGSFTEYGNASRLAQALERHGSVNIEPAAISGRNFYRVRIGPVEDVDAADTILSRLISDGFTESRVVVQ